MTAEARAPRAAEARRQRVRQRGVVQPEGVHLRIVAVGGRVEHQMLAVLQADSLADGAHHFLRRAAHQKVVARHALLHHLARVAEGLAQHEVGKHFAGGQIQVRAALLHADVYAVVPFHFRHAAHALVRAAAVPRAQEILAAPAGQGGLIVRVHAHDLRREREPNRF